MPRTFVEEGIKEEAAGEMISVRTMNTGIYNKKI
jgi:hypothetical protein